MKIIFTNLIVLVFALSSINGFSQAQKWEISTAFPGAARSEAISFTIDDIAYVGMGSDNTQKFTDFYKFDPLTEQWTQIASFPGEARSGAVAFTASGKGYVGTGMSSSSTRLKDFYEYNPTTNTWTAIAEFPGSARNLASAFSINNIGYVGLGKSVVDEESDFYKFNPASGTWSAIAGIGADNKRLLAKGFSVAGKGYITGGTAIESYTIVYSDVQSYDPTTDTWSEEVFADTKLSGLNDASLFVDDNNLVYLLGKSYSFSTSSYSAKSVKYDPSNNSVITFSPAFATKGRSYSVAFFVNNTAYAGLGSSSTSFGGATTYHNDLQKLITVEPPASPTNFSAYNITKTSARITWSRPSGVDSVIISISAINNNDYVELDTLTSSMYFDLTNLTEGTKYYIKVESIKEGVRSLPLLGSFATLSDVPIAISDLVADTSNILGFKLTWSRERTSYYDKYYIERAIGEGSFERIDTVDYGYTTEYYDRDITNKNSDLFRYRIFIYNPDKNTLSEASNIAEVTTEHMAPIAIEPSITTYSDRSYFSSYFSGETSKRVGNYIFQIATENEKFVSLDTTSYNYYRYYSYQELDTIAVRLIVSSEFGSDTSKISTFNTRLFTPSNLSDAYSTENFIGFKFRNESKLSKSVLVERSVNYGPFELYDSIESINQKYYSDEAIVPNTLYQYRLVNKKDNILSNTSSIIEIQSKRMVTWKKYKDDGLYSILESIKQGSFNNKFYNDGLVYLLSSETKQFKSFNLDTQELNSLPDFIGSGYKRFQATLLAENKFYCFGAVTEADSLIKDVWIYDIIEEEWSTGTMLPANIASTDIATDADNGRIIVIGKNETGNSIISHFDKLAKNWENTIALNYSFDPFFSEIKGDSLIVLSYYDRVAYNLNDHGTTRSKPLYYNSIPNRGITTQNGKNISITTSGIYEITTSAPYFKRTDIHTLDQYNGYAFVHDGKLFYGLADSDYKYTAYENDTTYQYIYTDILYYKDDAAPLPPANLRVEEISYTSATLKWMDLNEEDEYLLKYYDPSIQDYTTRSIAANSESFTLTELQQDRYYEFELFSVKDENLSAAQNVSFRTIRGVPYDVENFKATVLSSNSIRYEWDINDNLPVDSILIDNYNGATIRLGKNVTTYTFEGLQENSSQSVEIHTTNEFGRSYGAYSYEMTLLNMPAFQLITYREEIDVFELRWKDNSEYEEFFRIFRKSANDTAFIQIDSVLSSEIYDLENQLYIYNDDKNTPDGSYEYYIQAGYYNKDIYDDGSYYISENYSFPSDTLSTDHAVLSNKLAENGDTRIYPNPAESIITIDVNGLLLKQFELISINGERLNHTLKVIDNNKIDVSNIPTGLYFLKLHTSEGTFVHKLIKH